MNERIKLLALRASDYETGWLDRQKFAELIVRDCLAQVARVDDMLEDEPAQTAAVAWVASSIAQHFGVEE